MPKKSKSSPMKTILIIVVALIVGAGATLGFFYWSGGQQAETAKTVMKSQLKMSQLFTEAELAPGQMAKLADGKKITEARELGEKTLTQLDEVMELNQIVIDNTKGPQKEIEMKRQRLFQVQKGLTQEMIKAFAITNYQSPEAQTIQEKMISFNEEKQALIIELQNMLLGEEE